MWGQLLFEVAGAALRQVLFRSEPKRADCGGGAKATPDPKLVLQALESGHGGIHKRIAEVREITEAIRRRNPELFRQEYGLSRWLAYTDEYLCGLRDAAWPEGRSSHHDELRRRFDRHQPKPDYKALVDR